MNSRKAEEAVISSSRDTRLAMWSDSIDCIVIQHFLEVCHYQYVIPVPRYHWSPDTGLSLCSSSHPLKFPYACKLKIVMGLPWESFQFLIFCVVVSRSSLPSARYLIMRSCSHRWPPNRCLNVGSSVPVNTVSVNLLTNSTISTTRKTTLIATSPYVSWLWAYQWRFWADSPPGRITHPHSPTTVVNPNLVCYCQSLYRAAECWSLSLSSGIIAMYSCRRNLEPFVVRKTSDPLLHISSFSTSTNYLKHKGEPTL